MESWKVVNSVAVYTYVGTLNKRHRDFIPNPNGDEYAKLGEEEIENEIEIQKNKEWKINIDEQVNKLLLILLKCMVCHFCIAVYR